VPRPLPLLLVLLVTSLPPIARGVTAQARDETAAGEPVRLAIGQGVGTPPRLTVYVDLADESGVPPSSVASSRVTATVGASRSEVIQVTPFAATGEGVAYIFVVDVSRSVSAADMARVRAALTRWASASGSRDRLALITFGDDVTTRVDFTADRAQFIAAASRLSATDRRTRLHGALERAIELGRRGDADLPARRVAIVLSDGKDEGSGLTQDDVAALVRQDRMPIYAIGCSRLNGSDRAAGFDALRRLAANSGGLFQDASRTPLDDVYAAMQRAITRVFAIALKCEACPADGQLHRLDVRIAAGARVLSAGIDLRLPPPANGGANGGAGDGSAKSAGANPADASAAGASSGRDRAGQTHGGAHGLMDFTLVVIIVATLLILIALATWWFLRRWRRGRLSRATTGATNSGGALDSSSAGDAGEPAHDAAGVDPSLPSIGSEGAAITCHFRGHDAPPPMAIPLLDRALIGSDPSCDIVVALLRLGRTEMRVSIAPLETLRAPSRVDPITASRGDAVPGRRADDSTRKVTR
jgi:VWFA-related protein